MCGHSAAHLYGMVPYTPERLDVHLTREQERADQPAVRIHRTRLVLPRHVVDGLPVASPEDALLGLAREWRHRRAGPFAVRLAIQRADSLRLVTEDGLAAFAQKAKGLHGVRVLRAALEQLRAGDLDHSGTEAELRRIVREIATELGLEVTRRPHLIRHRGIPLAEPDVAILELRYGAQADGPHHREIRRRWRDEDQDEALTDLEWTIQRFTDEDIWVHRDRVRARVRRALHRLLRDRARRRR